MIETDQLDISLGRILRFQAADTRLKHSSSRSRRVPSGWKLVDSTSRAPTKHPKSISLPARPAAGSSAASSEMAEDPRVFAVSVVAGSSLASRSRPRDELNTIAAFGQEQRRGRSDRPGSNHDARVDGILPSWLIVSRRPRRRRAGSWRRSPRFLPGARRRNGDRRRSSLRAVRVATRCRRLRG